MGKKLTYKYVAGFFKDQGCELLSDEYVNNYTKLNYICECGNKAEISFNSFQYGTRCIKCSGNEKHTLESVKKYFVECGCKLLSDIYVNNNTHLDYICECGNKSEITLKAFKRGERCKKCGIEKSAKSKRFDYLYVKQCFEHRDCTLISLEYVNNQSPLDYICSCGNRSKITFDSFKRGCRCGKCAKNEKFDYDYVKNFFDSHGCKLLSKEYVNNNTHLDYICVCGNRSQIIFSSFKNGHRCQFCRTKKMTGPNNSNWIANREIAHKNNLFSKKFGNMVRRCFNVVNKEKQLSSVECLGYNRQQLIDHLVNHPNWQNVKHNYHIDHFFPVVAFIEHNILDPKIINALDNLQPLSPKDNISKNDNYNKEDFINYLRNKYGDEFIAKLNFDHNQSE